MTLYDVWNGESNSFIMRAPSHTLGKLLYIYIPLLKVRLDKGETVQTSRSGIKYLIKKVESIQPTDAEVSAVFDQLTVNGWSKPDHPSDAIHTALTAILEERMPVL